MGSSWTWADLELGTPGSLGLSLAALQVCSDWSWQQSTGQAHTLSLSLCWSPLWSNGDGLLMDLGRPGIGHSRDLGLVSHCCISLRQLVLATEYWSAHCSPLSLSLLVTALHGHGLVSMDLGCSVELGTLGWSVELAWTWAGLWNWALHGPGLVCGIGHSMDLSWSVELGTPWTWAVFTLELGAPWAWGLWSLWIWETPRTWGLPVPPNSLSLCCTECLFPSLWHSGSESINTNSGPNDGKWTYTPLFPRDGYHAFRGPHTVAWGQRPFSDADWECSYLNFHILIIFTKNTPLLSFPRRPVAAYRAGTAMAVPHLWGT